MTPGHERRILRASRVLGWGLAAMVLFFGAAAGLRVHDAMARRHAVGWRHARGFIEKVIACRRLTPAPHPSWDECERRVRAAE